MKKLFAVATLFLAGVSFHLYAGDKPGFPGGDSALKKYLSENVRYPEISKENGVEGIVTVGFVVNTDGSLNNVKVLKFIDPDLEKEAVRVVSGMPAWIPAEKNGTPIEAPSQVEIPFVLE